jgi:hypothetical protein
MVGGLDELRTKLSRTLFIVAAAALVAAGCDRAVEAGGRPAQPAALPGMIIDSILPPGEALRRFQSELPAVAELVDAPRSRDRLVSEFVEALERADTATLAKLRVSKPEYAFLYYPTSVYSAKPYELPPDVAWLLSEQNSQKGAIRLLRRLSGRDLHFDGYACGASAHERDNVFWRDCQVSYLDPATSVRVTRQLFGAIMQREGRYKFLSYANDF